MTFADFGHVFVSVAGEKNGLERVDNGQKPDHRLTGEVRRFLQESATVRGNWRESPEKNPNRERLGLVYWWCIATRFKPRL